MGDISSKLRFDGFKGNYVIQMAKNLFILLDDVEETIMATV